MQKLHLYVTFIPEGEAPLWVREKWVGLSLPVTQRKAAPRSLLGAGVLSGPQNFMSCLVALISGKLIRQSGFVVEAQAAITLLAVSSPEAAAWWRENTPHLLRGTKYLLFDQSVGHIVAA